jgi:hypothetical protein
VIVVPAFGVAVTLPVAPGVMRTARPGLVPKALGKVTVGLAVGAAVVADPPQLGRMRNKDTSTAASSQCELNGLLSIAILSFTPSSLSESKT